MTAALPIQIVSYTTLWFKADCHNLGKISKEQWIMRSSLEVLCAFLKGWNLLFRQWLVVWGQSRKHVQEYGKSWAGILLLCSPPINCCAIASAKSDAIFDKVCSGGQCVSKDWNLGCSGWIQIPDFNNLHPKWRRSLTETVGSRCPVSIIGWYCQPSIFEYSEKHSGDPVLCRLLVRIKLSAG